MTDSRTKNAALNIVFSILLQIVTFFRGLILPHIIIPAYGSDINGLISSITQFLAYISLLEAGVGSVFRASLYNPLSKGDVNGVSGIINEQKRFYRKIGIIFIFYMVALCVFYPFIAKTDIGRPYIISCILILSISTFAEYFVSLPYVSLLYADQKVRISYIVSIVYVTVNILVSLFWVSLKADIRLIYLSMSIIGLLRPVFYTLYVRKHYKLNKKVKASVSSLNQRWNGMVHHFAYYIHTNTDSAILTIFIGTAMVSVYNIYGAIIFGIEKVITSVSNGTAAGIGNVIALNDKERINQTVNAFEFVQGSVTTVFYTITALLLIPFIKIYTVNMTDMNYMRPAFGYVLIIAEAIYCFRCIYSTISASANKFKETQVGAVLECVTNIAVSLTLVLVFKLSILGVAIGTVIGMLARYIFEVVFLSKNVIYRTIFLALKMVAVSAAAAFVSVLICNSFMDYSSVKTLSTWFGYATITAVIVGITTLIIYSIFYRNIIVFFINRLRGKE